MNTWMNNSQYLAQIGHVLAGYSIILTVGLLSQRFHSNWLPLLVTTALFITIALLKEFWYDFHYELPIQTFGDSFMDFSFYMVGGAVGWIFVAIFLYGIL